MTNRLLLLALGGGASAAVVLLLTRRSAAAPYLPSPSNPEPGVPPMTQYGELEKVAIPVPAGWRRATNQEVADLPELVTAARTLRGSSGFTSMQYGTLQPFQASNGKTYATWVEQHYHEPGGSVKPWGLHHGVTILAKYGQ